MKRKILLLILLFAAAFPAFAQIEEEIQQSKTEKIAKGRAYLLEKFLDRDYGKVKEIKDYLLELEDDNYCALAPMELWHVMLWTKEFEVLAADMKQVDPVRTEAFSNKVKPEKDELGKQLYRRSVEDEHLIRFSLQEAQLPAEDNEFLTLFLDWDLKQNSSENQKQWNERVDKFLADYPNSGYKWYANNIIRQPYLVDSDWGFGMGFNLCSGFSTGSLAQPIIGFGLDFDIAYKRLFMFLGYHIMAANTRIDQHLSDGGLCPKGTHVGWMPMYADLGYAVVDNHSTRITPFVGIGGIMETYGTQKHPEYEELEKNMFLYQGGLSFDIKTYGRLQDGFIRIRYCCGANGLGKEKVSMTHLFSVVAGGFSRGTKRVY